jgi:hypothetical protein
MQDNASYQSSSLYQFRIARASQTLCALISDGSAKPLRMKTAAIEAFLLMTTLL